MKNFINNLKSMSVVQKMTVFFSLIFIAGLGGFLAFNNGSQNYRLLYADLDLRASGQIIEHLEAQNIPFDVKNNAIYIASDQVARTRMDLASKGIPNSNTPGYELLDKINGFQTTNRMYNVNYVRALEGELAQTIATSELIEKARVHIAHDQGAGVLRPSKISASVMITPVNGTTFVPENARSIQHLVSSALSNMSPNDVNVIDTAGNLLTDRRNELFIGTKVEDKVREKLTRLLAARFGVGQSVVEVSIEQTAIDEIIRERIIDPNSRVALRQESEETQSQRDDGARGIAGVASNLPERDDATGSVSSDSETQSKAKIQYDISQTEREISNPAGAIKKMSVAVLVNKQAFEQSAQSLDALTALLSAAAGVDEERGDSIKVEAMSFAPMTIEGQTLPGSVSHGSGAFDGSSPIPMWIWPVLALAIVGIAFATIIGRRKALPLLYGQEKIQNNGAEPLAIAPIPVEEKPELIAPEEALKDVIASQEESAIMLIKNWLDEGQTA